MRFLARQAMALTLLSALLIDTRGGLASAGPVLPAQRAGIALFSTEALSLLGREEPHSKLNSGVTIPQCQTEISLLRQARLTWLLALLIAIVPEFGHKLIAAIYDGRGFTK